MIKNRAYNIALVGNPNAGKSSLFNALTGLNQKVGNFPGVTVDKKTGKCKLSDGQSVNIIDLPGTYSLYPKSADEYVTADVLFDEDEAVKIDLILILADASNLKRNLLFCSQIIDLKRPVIVALTMLDLAEKKGMKLDLNGLQRDLGVPVLSINPRKNKGTKELKKSIEKQLTGQKTIPPFDFIDNLALAPKSITAVKEIIDIPSDYAALHIMAGLDHIQFVSSADKDKIKERLKEHSFNKTKIQAQEVIQRYKKIKTIMSKSVVEADPLRKQLFSEQLDKYLLHPIGGYLILFSVLFLLFQSIFWLSAFPTDWIDENFTAVISWVEGQLPTHFLSDLLVNGLLAGINGIIVFIPQIMILFGLITLLEDSGYMARISFLSDRLMRRVGLNGKSVMPLMSGFACAVPAIMAARTIENKKEKLLTILITPLMSCSARLPVYTILIGLVIPSKTVLGVFSLQGLVMMLLYLFSFFVALLVAALFNIFIKVKDKSIFLMELPTYRAPRWGNVLNTMIQQARVFVFEAGKVILVISVILWGLSSYGVEKTESQTDYFAKTSLTNSYAGSVGKFIEPAIKPIGFDWKIGIALITSFAAREVFVGTMATLYSVEDDNEKSLRAKMAKAKWSDGSKIYSTATGISLMIFYAFAMQCMSTLAIVKRETNSWKIPAFQFLYMGALAYIFSFIFYQLFS